MNKQSSTPFTNCGLKRKTIFGKMSIVVMIEPFTVSYKLKGCRKTINEDSPLQVGCGNEQLLIETEAPASCPHSDVESS
jgi:hypothetical protein